MSLWNPAAYQGPRNLTDHNDDYYESLCYKLVDARGRLLLLKPCCIVDGKTSALRAELQVEKDDGTIRIFAFSADEFEYSRDAWRLRLGACLFSDRRLELKLKDAEGGLNGRVNLHGGRGWPVRLLELGAMGRNALIPGVDNHYQVLNFDCSLSGSIQLDGEEYTLIDGRGFVEKSWGRKTPEAWLRLQSNSFHGGGISLVAVLGSLRRGHKGFIVGLWLRGELHRFCSYTGAYPRLLDLNDDTLRMKLEDDTRGLELELNRSRRSNKTPAELLSARYRSTVSMTNEQTGALSLRHYHRTGGGDHTEYEAESRHALLSYDGSVMEMIEEMNSGY